MLTNTYECLAIILRSLRFVANCIRKPIRLIFATFWRICREYICLHSQGYSPQCESSIRNNVCIYYTYLFLSCSSTMIIYFGLACIYKYIHNSFLFFKAFFLVYFSYILSCNLTLGILIIIILLIICKCL